MQRTWRAPEVHGRQPARVPTDALRGARRLVIETAELCEIGSSIVGLWTALAGWEIGSSVDGGEDVLACNRCLDTRNAGVLVVRSYVSLYSRSTSSGPGIARNYDEEMREREANSDHWHRKTSSHASALRARTRQRKQNQELVGQKVTPKEILARYLPERDCWCSPGPYADSRGVPGLYGLKSVVVGLGVDGPLEVGAQ